MDESVNTGYTAVNGVQMYWEALGSGGVPLVVVHGGFGQASSSAALRRSMAADRRVIAVELQGHGHTADVERPFSYEAFGDDLAELIASLEVGPADLLGYSLGAGASLRATLQHPELVWRLALVSFPFRRSGWFPEVRAGMDQMNAGTGFALMSQSPLYADWLAVAPDPEAFPTLMDKTGDLLRRPFDWTEEVRGMRTPTLLVYGDADSIPPSHGAEFFALLGGGLADGSWDGSTPTEMRLAILPGVTHYNIFERPELVDLVSGFFSG